MANSAKWKPDFSLIKAANAFRAIEQYAAILLRNDDAYIARKCYAFEEQAKRAEGQKGSGPLSQRSQ